MYEFKRLYPETKITKYRLRKLYQECKVKKKVIRKAKITDRETLEKITMQAADLS